MASVIGYLLLVKLLHSGIMLPLFRVGFFFPVIPSFTFLSLLSRFCNDVASLTVSLEFDGKTLGLTPSNFSKTDVAV